MDDLEVARRAATAGVDVVAAAFGSAISARYKAHHDPVTEVDRAAESAITAVLRKRRPKDGIQAEEGAGASLTGRRWIVDPLDGTVNFIHGIPQLAVSVALWADDEPVVGVVVDVLRREVFAAARGKGATLDGQPITVSNTRELDAAVVATGFPYDHSKHAAAYTAGLQAMLSRVNGIRRFGSAALDLAWVAVGRFDAYWEMQVAPWDMAAGAVIVEEAGGLVGGIDGSPPTPRSGPILASNGLLHEPIRSILQPHIPDHLRESVT